MIARGRTSDHSARRARGKLAAGGGVAKGDDGRWGAA